MPRAKCHRETAQRCGFGPCVTAGEAGFSVWPQGPRGAGCLPGAEQAVGVKCTLASEIRGQKRVFVGCSQERGFPRTLLWGQWCYRACCEPLGSRRCPEHRSWHQRLASSPRATAGAGHAPAGAPRAGHIGAGGRWSSEPQCSLSCLVSVQWGTGRSAGLGSQVFQGQQVLVRFVLCGLKEKC